MSGRLPERAAPEACHASGAPLELETADFPPPFSARMALPGEDVRRAAIRAARTGELGAADILWGFDGLKLEMVIVLEPDEPLEKAREMGDVLARAATDALASLLPPQVAISAGGDGAVTINGGMAGRVFLDASTDEPCEVPVWLNAGLTLHIHREEGLEGGQAPQEAVVSEEGGGRISPATLAAEAARHFLLRLDEWRNDNARISS